MSVDLNRSMIYNCVEKGLKDIFHMYKSRVLSDIYWTTPMLYIYIYIIHLLGFLFYVVDHLQFTPFIPIVTTIRYWCEDQMKSVSTQFIFMTLDIKQTWTICLIHSKQWSIPLFPAVLYLVAVRYLREKTYTESTYSLRCYLSSSWLRPLVSHMTSQLTEHCYTTSGAI